MRDTHADPLVQPRRSGRILGVDPEPDAPRPPRVELPEGVLQQRLAETPATVPRPGAEDVDPAHPELLAAAERGGGRIAVLRPDDERELRLEAAARKPFLVRAPRVPPMVGEGLLDRLVQLALAAGAQLLDLEPRRPLDGRRLLVEVDDHAEEGADRREAAAPEKTARAFVGAEDGEARLGRAELAAARLDPVDDRGPDAAAERLGVDVAVAVVALVAALQEDEADELAVVEHQTRLALAKPPVTEVSSARHVRVVAEGGV